MPEIKPPVPPHIEEPQVPPADGIPEQPLSVYQKITGKSDYATPYEILKIPESATKMKSDKHGKTKFAFDTLIKIKIPKLQMPLRSSIGLMQL